MNKRKLSKKIAVNREKHQEQSESEQQESNDGKSAQQQTKCNEKSNDENNSTMLQYGEDGNNHKIKNHKKISKL